MADASPGLWTRRRSRVCSKLGDCPVMADVHARCGNAGPGSYARDRQWRRLQVLNGLWEILKNLPLLPVCMQSTPSRELFSLTCRDLMAASVSIGLKPEFSAKAIGTESKASAKARMAYCSRPGLCKYVLDLLYDIAQDCRNQVFESLP